MRKRSIKGYGITADGRRIDINSPEFKLEDYSSVLIEEELTKSEVIALFPELFEHAKKDKTI